MSIATASSNAVFEVQQLRNGNWGCISTHGNQTDAIEEAKGIFEQNQNVQARVVQEAFDSTSERYVKKIIFRSQTPITPHKVHETSQEAAYSRVAARAKTRNQKEKQRRANRDAQRRTARRNTLFYTKIMLFTALICGGGLAALYALMELR